MHSMRARLAKVFSKAKVKQILIINTDREDSNFLYLTGFKGGLFEGTVLLARRSSMTLFLGPLEYGMAKRQKPREMKLVLIENRGMLREMLNKELKERRVGINGYFVPYMTYKSFASKLKAKFVDVSDGMMEARLVKGDSELRAMRRAVSITKGALSAGKAALKPGVTELQVAAAIDTHMLSMGATTAFTSIVAFDANTALPHHAPGGARLGRNSIVLFDIGARVDNYCADMTRTFMFRPDIGSEKYRRFTDMYSVVRKAQEIGLSKIKEGAKGEVAHKAAAKYIDKYKGGIYKGKFIHSLGHSIGLEVHDGGAGLYPGCKTKLKENMVFSDEPGIYIDGFGGVRIEDDVVVGKSSSTFM
ncbi:MAG: aminopeptidase P family protein [Candidatus Micrarchaeota archaeon]|nr:aminopeptidase P family protein [Candidatus Micrarchaeota archaeon]